MIMLSIVIPVYNEQETLSALYESVNVELEGIERELKEKNPSVSKPQVEVLLVNDGSTDNSRPIMESMVQNNSAYRLISLSRNFGHQAAVSAGMRSARGAAVVLMDADLQDPPELIKGMIEKWNKGFDVVYAVRRKREAKFVKNMAYKAYYRVKALLSDYPVQKDSGDFSLLDRKVVDIINILPEKDRYMRGLRAWVGFKQAELQYDRMDRKSGKSKYATMGLIKLAVQGITSTSVKPLFVSGFFGAISVVTIIGIIAYVLFSKIYVPQDLMPKGWASTMITIAFLSGCQLMSIWFLSIYMAKLYREILARPTYIIDYDSLAEIKKR